MALFPKELIQLPWNLLQEGVYPCLCVRFRNVSLTFLMKAYFGRLNLSIEIPSLSQKNCIRSNKSHVKTAKSMCLPSSASNDINNKIAYRHSSRISIWTVDVGLCFSLINEKGRHFVNNSPVTSQLYSMHLKMKVTGVA